jgi:hypothetical protein
MSESAEQKRKREQRERTAKHRAKVKQQAQNDDLANEQKSRDDFDSWRVSQRLVSPGEIEAFVNAESLADAIISCREFLVVLGVPDIQPNESLLSAERRVLTAWCEAGAPLLSRNNLRFAEETRSDDGYAFDFDKWIPIEGSDAPIDATLSVIVVPEVVEVSPAADTPITVEHWRLPAYAPTLEEQLAMEHRHKMGLCPVAPREALVLKIRQDAMDEKSRKLSQANENREQANERRLGVSYVPSSELHFRNNR